MPLPALPAHTTKRYKLIYTAYSIAHSITVHMDTAAAASDATALATALANLLKPLVGPAVVFTGVQFAALGEDVFNDVATLNIAGTGAANGAGIAPDLSISFTGRSPSGRKTRMFLFGPTLPGDSNWRLTRTEWPAVGTVIDGLNNTDVGGIRVIDASKPVWHSYVNWDYNDHYVKRARRTRP